MKADVAIHPRAGSRRGRPAVAARAAGRRLLHGGGGQNVALALQGSWSDGGVQKIPRTPSVQGDCAALLRYDTDILSQENITE